MYATKRRRRNVKPIKSPVKDPPKSNPSKRHRERLNSELDHLASLLPFEQSVISKLDKLSILRLAVSYLRTKSYFQSAIHERYSQENQLLHRLHHRIHHGNQIYSDVGLVDSESVLQALNGFLFIVTCDGEVFFASHTVEQYLGFHQSDIIHQSVMELIHSEDREQFKMQLNWRSSLPQESADLTVDQALSQDNCHLLRRCFTARFRCLLDNTSGFITLEISGKIRVLHGQSLKGDGSPLALFALCSPFGPLPLNDVASRDMHTFKSKHKMDMSPISMDPRKEIMTESGRRLIDVTIALVKKSMSKILIYARELNTGKMFFGYTDRELLEKGGYDLVHTDDLTYYAAAHQELIKTGSSGLIAYRLLTKDFNWIWLQTSSKVIYKNSKPDFVICTHRQLTDDEGRDLARKRGSEFKLPYAIIDVDPSVSSTLDDISSTYPVVHCGSTASSMTSPPTAASEIMSTVGTLAQQVTQQQLPPPPTTVAAKSKTRANRKSSSGTSASGNGTANAGSNKNQLRDYLQAGRKRKAPSYHDLYAAATAGLVSPYHVVAAAAAVAAVGAGAPAGYGPVPHGGNPINGSCYPTSGYPVGNELKQELAYNSTHSSSSAYINAADDPYRAASFGYHQAALYADSFQFDDRTPSIVGSYYGGSSLSNGYYYYPPTPGTTCVDQYAAAAAAAASGFPQYANYMADFHTNSASATTAAAASAGTGSGTGIGPASGSSSNGSMTSPSRYGRTSRTSGYYNGGLDLTARAVAFQQYAGAAASSDQRDVISLFDPSDVGSRRRYASGRTGATDCAAGNAGLFNPLLTSGYLYGNGSDSDVTASISGRNVRGGIGEESTLVAQHMQQQHAELTAGMCESQSNRFATTGYCVAGNVQYSSSPNEHHQQQQVVGATIADCTVIRRSAVADDQGSPRRTPPNWQQQQQIECDINSARTPAVKPSTRPHDDVTSTSSLQNTLSDAATVRSTNQASSCIGMATSVIQLPGRRRTYEKEQTASNPASGTLVGTSGSAISSGGGVAVPVVKSTPSAAVAAWIQSAAAAAAASDTSTSYWTNSYGVSQPRAALHDNSISSPAKVVCYGESCW